MEVELVLGFWTGEQLKDCLCIPQHDDVLKEQCVRGLANFLGKSDKLVVLWSPRYFRRASATSETQTEPPSFVLLRVLSLRFGASECCLHPYRCR